MAKDANGTGMAYKGDEGSVSVYTLWFEDREVLEAAVDNNDPELKIWIGKPGGVRIETKGRADKGLHEVSGTSETPGDLKDHIDGMTVQSYVLPRALRFVMDLYVPKA